MSEKISISLIGAGSYGTLKRVFQKGVSHEVPTDEWLALRGETNPSTGEQLFCLTADLPKDAQKAVETAALTEAGLGEIDTGLKPEALEQTVEEALSEEDEAALAEETVPAPKKLTIGKGKTVTV